MGTFPAVVIVLVLVLIWYFWPKSQQKQVEEQFTIAREKLNRAYAYDGYQNALLQKCFSCKEKAQIAPEDQAKLISLGEMNKTLTQRINDLDGALITIQTAPDKVRRVAIINSALDKLWALQCDQNKRLMELKSFTFVYPRVRF